MVYLRAKSSDDLRSREMISLLEIVCPPWAIWRVLLLRRLFMS